MDKTGVKLLFSLFFRGKLGHVVQIQVGGCRMLLSNIISQ